MLHIIINGFQSNSIFKCGTGKCFLFCVSLENRKLSTRIYRDGAVLISITIPVLHHPVGEHFVGRCLGSGTRHSIGIIRVELAIEWWNRSTIGIIFHINTIRTNQNFAPFGIDFILFGNPETVSRISIFILNI